MTGPLTEGCNFFLGGSLRMWQEILNGLLSRHRGKTIGAILGLLLSLLIIRFGLLLTLFIAFSTLMGYYVGKRIDENKEGILEIIERYSSPWHRT